MQQEAAAARSVAELPVALHRPLPTPPRGRLAAGLPAMGCDPRPGFLFPVQSSQPEAQPNLACLPLCVSRAERGQSARDPAASLGRLSPCARTQESQLRLSILAGGCVEKNRSEGARLRELGTQPFSPERTHGWSVHQPALVGPSTLGCELCCCHHYCRDPDSLCSLKDRPPK